MSSAKLFTLGLEGLFFPGLYRQRLSKMSQGVDSRSKRPPEFVSINEESQHKIVHVFCLIHAAANFASFLAFRGLTINESTF